ncbi:hypothetical protein ABZY31_11065 [Streptomyces sp. NPDC006529]|uniref:hypothetical protein n=1 Tax=Streptomyces sp. NPDC006529 TaxID=3157177 RepID=UPI0033BD601D
MRAFDVVEPVLVAAFLGLAYRTVRTTGVGLRVAVLVMAVFNAGLLWTLAETGPSWSVPVVGAFSLVCAVFSALAAARALLGRIAFIDDARYAEIVDQVGSAREPQVLGLCVLYNGTLAVTAFSDDARPEGRLHHLRTPDRCGFCLVEDRMRDLLGEPEALVEEYRTHLRAGRSRHFLVRRRSPEEPWTGRLRDRIAYRLPKVRPPCDVHDPLLAGRG